MQHGAASASAMKMAMARPFSSTQSVLMAAKSKSKSNLITKINIAEHVAAEHELSKAKSKRIVDSIVDFMTQVRNLSQRNKRRCMDVSMRVYAHTGWWEVAY